MVATKNGGPGDIHFEAHWASLLLIYLGKLVQFGRSFTGSCLSLIYQYPAELEKLKRLLWEEVVGGPNKRRLYGTGGIYGNMLDSGASTSESLSPEARRIIQSLTDQFARHQETMEEKFTRQQQLIDYVFSQSGIPAPPPDWQPPEQDLPAQQDQDAQHDQDDAVDDGDGGDHMDHTYERGY